jgi:hypothetical protein
MSFDFEEYTRNERTKHDARMKQAKALICKMLVEQMPEAVRVEIQYQGSGDSGNIEWVTAYSLSGEKLKNPPEIENHAWTIAYGAHPGFEINEGGGGTITVYPHENRITVSHFDYVIEEVYDNDREI